MLYDRISEYCEMNNISIREMELRAGVGAGSVSKWKKGDYEPSKKSLQKIADFFNVTISNLIDEENIEIEENQTVSAKIPILGSVVAGLPIEAIENNLGWVEIPYKMATQGRFFALKIRGDSMQPSICQGDLVVVKSASTADNNDIVIASIDSNDACVKKLIKHKEGISLVSINSSYAPLYFSENDIMNERVKIIGIVVELRRKIK